VYISIITFFFCLGFAVFLGYFFAWIYNYRDLHKEPKGKPQKVTDTIPIPVDIALKAEQENTAIKRMEQERTSYEIDAANKDAFIKKLLMLFRSRLEKESSSINSICYWAYNGEGFALRISNSNYRIRENLFVPKNNKYFLKKEFNWNGFEEAPIDVFHAEEQITRSLAGAMVSGDGKIHGYITIDSMNEKAFSDEICMELRELANVAMEVLRTLDWNFRLDRENNMFYGMLKNISTLFFAVSKENLIANLSRILQDNFIFNRLTIITPYENEKWLISEAVGEQKESFKGVIFDIHEKCLLYELLARRVSIVNEKKIPTDPYQRRLYENEPENLELRSLFAIMPPVQNGSYPLAVVLESRENKAVFRIDETILTCIVSCAAIKLSSIQSKDSILQKREEDIAGIDSNGIGEILKHYGEEFDSLKANTDSNDGLGILFFKCRPARKENKAHDFESYLSVFKKLKSMWNGHLSILGGGEFIFSFKADFNEDVFKLTAKQIITIAENSLANCSLPVKSYMFWQDRNRIEDVEQKMNLNYIVLFEVTVMNKFKELSGDDE
jgi:hypothetical protein